MFIKFIFFASSLFVLCVFVFILSNNVTNPKIVNLNKNNPIENPNLVFNEINEYRNKMDLPILKEDGETCRIAERYASEGLDKLGLKDENYKDLCPTCINLGAAQGIDFNDTSNLINAWTGDTNIKANMENSIYKFGCVKSKDKRIVYIFTNKGSEVSGENLTPIPAKVTNKQSQIECWGPDGETFMTTQNECDTFRAAWGLNNNGSKITNNQNQPSTNTNAVCNNVSIACTYTTNYGGTITRNTFGCTYKEAYDECDALQNRNQCSVNAWTKYDQSGAKCKASRENGLNICVLSYTGSNPLIENNPTKYDECASEVWQIYNTCQDDATSTRNSELNGC